MNRTDTPSDDLPLVSMLIPSYNHSKYVQDSIASVIRQDYRNIELIIIDDGSTDDSADRIREMLPECMERFVRFEYRVKENGGIAAAINDALAWSQGQYFAVLASDDMLLPHKTSIQVENIHGEAGVAAVFGGAEIVDAEGSTLGYMKPRGHLYGFDELYQRKMPICAPTQLMRTDLLRQVGGITQGVHIEDWYTCLKLAHAGYSIKTVPEILVKYRRHGTNVSSDGLKNFESRKYILNLYRESPYYGPTMAAVHLMMAIDLSAVSKKSSIGFLYKSATFDKSVVGTRRFWFAAVKVLIPKSVAARLRELKKDRIINNSSVKETW